nr:hypothetical protein [Alphaproteobacteria bacterium]
TRGFAILGAFFMHASFIFFLHVGLFPYVCMFYLFLLIPDGWFDAFLARRRARLEKITLYFEPGCAFCEKTARLLRELCLSPFTAVHAASEDKEALDLLTRHKSWVVKDAHTGKVYLKWQAVAFVLRQNPFTWILGALTDVPLMTPVYDLIGRSRPLLGKITAVALPFSYAHPRVHPAAKALCAFLIVMAFAGNVLSLPGFPKEGAFSSWLRRGVVFSLVSQKWDLFAPVPTHAVYDYKASGITEAGQNVDLTPQFEHGAIWRTDSEHVDFQSHHWLKYFVKLFEQRHHPVVMRTLEILCRDYNADAAHADKLKEASLMLKRVAHAQAGQPSERTIHESLNCGAQ